MPRAVLGTYGIFYVLCLLYHLSQGIMHMEVIFTPEIIIPNLIPTKILCSITKRYVSTILQVLFLSMFGQNSGHIKEFNHSHTSKELNKHMRHGSNSSEFGSLAYILWLEIGNIRVL